MVDPIKNQPQNPEASHKPASQPLDENKSYDSADNGIKKSIKKNRQVYNIIRTTKRNNIDLKSIADNKANILMSVNALMITILIPIILSNLDIILKEHLWIPMVILAITCLITLFLSASVLTPFSLDGEDRKMRNNQRSPFFFANYHKMNADDYFEYFMRTVKNEDILFRHIVDDLHYYGKILGIKYSQIKAAYNVFKIGLSSSIVITFIILIFF